MASEGLLKRETKVKYVEDDVCDDTLVIDQMFTQWRGQSEYHRSLFREKLGILWWDQHSPNVWWDQHSPNVVTGFHLFLLLWIMKAWLPDKAEVSFLCRLLLIFHVLDCLESLSHHWAPSASLLFGKDSLNESVAQLHRNNKNSLQRGSDCRYSKIFYPVWMLHFAIVF